MALKLFSRKQESPTHPENIGPGRKPTRRQRAETAYDPAEAIALHEDALHRCFQLERYGLIVNCLEHWQSHPEIESVAQQAADQINDMFAIVPEGFVTLPQMVTDTPGGPDVDYESEAFLLSRFAVTNAQFQKFVDGGGYEELELWPKDIWPCLIDFVDQTEQHAPRFWRNRRHDKRLADHPVVGVCFYEASAYAHWAGFRLPSEVEWQMAASWRIRSAAHIMRRFPWGDTLDKQRCNIWISGRAQTAPVGEYPRGSAPNGVLQLIGNVWEWTSTDFEVMNEEGRPVVGDTLLKSVRGGAFDTYFPSQATSFFRTGLASLIRAHNAGFRLAMDVPDKGE